jgi:hypothetical protein
VPQPSHKNIQVLSFLRTTNVRGVSHFVDASILPRAGYGSETAKESACPYRLTQGRNSRRIGAELTSFTTVLGAAGTQELTDEPPMRLRRCIALRHFDIGIC